MNTKPEAPAARRNREAILEVLAAELDRCETVLEIGSGTGQHAVFMGRHMPWLTWQTSDLEENHDGIRAWVEDAGLDNVRDPLRLDVRQPDLPETTYDAVFSANTAHIMHFDAVECLFSVVASVIAAGGLFCLYGPFNLDGEYTSDSNRDFDASLKRQDPGMGIRNLEDLDRIAELNGLSRVRLYAMPANNMLAVWQKLPAATETDEHEDP